MNSNYTADETSCTSIKAYKKKGVRVLQVRTHIHYYILEKSLFTHKHIFNFLIH